MSRLLSADEATADEVTRLVERWGGDPEAVLHGAEARLEGVRRTGVHPNREDVVWAVQATLDSLDVTGQDGPGVATGQVNRTGHQSPSLRRAGCLAAIEVRPTGKGHATVLVSRLNPPERLLLDIGILASLAVRRRMVNRLPEDVRAEGSTLLDELAQELDGMDGPSHPIEAPQGTGIEFERIEPWPDYVRGGILLGELEAVIRRYVVLPPHCALAVALWVLHVHALDAADVSPILCISSPVKRCGKTTLQGVLRNLVPRPLAASNISGPALFRTIEKYHPTVLLDEADSYLVQREDMRNLLNAGVQREDAYVYRIIGEKQETRRFSVFGAKTISLIGALPGTLEDRSIVVRLKRKTKNEVVGRLRGRKAPEVLRPLREMAARWGLDNVDALRRFEPVIPECLNDRAADFWEPLLAIADSIGGVWPVRARDAATALSGGDVPPDDSPALQLLSDLRDVLLAEGGRIASKTFVGRLAALDERPWSTWRLENPITVNQVAKLLRRFEGVSPRTLRLDRERAKGYDLDACRDAFERYLPANSPSQELKAFVGSSSPAVTP